MIKAQHNPAAQVVFNLYVMHLLKKHFCGFYLLGDIPKVHQDKPVLLLPNHSTWWDGFFVHFLNKRLFNRRLFLMMLESELSQNPFFAHVGAFSVQPHSVKVRKSLQYSQELLEKSENQMLCLFPQGILQHANTHPLVFYKGAEWIINKTENAVEQVLLGIKVEMLDEQLPHVFFRFEKVSDFISLEEKQDKTRLFQSRMTKILQEMDSLIQKQKYGTLLMNGNTSINKRRIFALSQRGR